MHRFHWLHTLKCTGRVSRMLSRSSEAARIYLFTAFLCQGTRYCRRFPRSGKLEIQTLFTRRPDSWLIRLAPFFIAEELRGAEQDALILDYPSASGSRQVLISRDSVFQSVATNLTMTRIIST